MKTCVNFTAAQVLAALRGEVVVVREAVKPQPSKEVIAVDNVGNGEFVPVISAPNRPFGICLPFGIKCPYTIGGTLWVRETWAKFGMVRPDGSRYTVTVYRADTPIGYENMAIWRPANRMPRFESRLSVTVQSVAVKQVDGGWEWVAEMVKVQP